uniref:Retrotransposon gag domain-containing protein n=1 Tax=Lactuca sativa TaxID=4236 RepID=A0A9R1XVT8_LACSA|nr:hypothetical protein LSAT_V11C100028230 [Lactuca sativa]
MATLAEDLMKKLEEFLIRHEQSNNEIKGAISHLQAKYVSLEEGLSKQTNSKNRSEASMEEEGEQQFEDINEPNQGRGKGSNLGAQEGRGFISSTGVVWGRGEFGINPNNAGKRFGINPNGTEKAHESESWRSTYQPKFKYKWDTLKGQASTHNQKVDQDHMYQRRTEPEQGFKIWDETDEVNGYKATRVPKFTKIEFPTYDGKDDPLAWLHKCEDFFEEQQTPTEAWVRQATFVLQGKESDWYRNLRRMKGRPTWNEFAEECKIRFGPPMSMNPLGELTQLRQTGTVEDYCASFESLLGKTTRVTPEQSMLYFCAGLINVIRYEVEFVRPITLYYAMNLARQIELRVVEARQPIGVGPTGNQISAGSQKQESVGKGGAGNYKTETLNPAWKTLTSVEMVERRAKGLCFNCDEIFSIGHKCAKLFCIMMDNEEDDANG